MLINIEKYITKEISGIIQVGAHVGSELPILQKISNRILMFEPQKNIYQKLLITINNNPDIIAENFALGSSNGIVNMHKEYANEGQSSSIMEPALHVVQYPGITFNDIEEIEVKTLDSYFKNKLFNYNLMLLDVQGYELEVLKGSVTNLKSIDYILCEVNRAELYKGCPMVEEIDSFLNDYGFKREITSWDGYTWGDALYVK